MVVVTGGRLDFDVVAVDKDSSCADEEMTISWRMDLKLAGRTRPHNRRRFVITISRSLKRLGVRSSFHNCFKRGRLIKNYRSPTYKKNSDLSYQPRQKTKEEEG